MPKVIFVDNTVTSGFQNKPAYRYIRKTDKLPTYTEIRDIPDAEILCKVKLFNPTGIGTWFLAAYDPEDHIAWGVCQLQETEVGSVSMDELGDYRDSRFGLPLERDLYWTPQTVAELS